MLTMFRQLLDLMDAYDRRRATIVLLLTLVVALLDVVGVASIMPFMAVVADTKVVQTNAMLSRAYHGLGFTDPQRFLMALGIVVFVTLVVSQALKALGAYAQLRFALMREASFSERLMAGYLRQPYQWFLHRHSADLSNIILGQVSAVVHNALIPMLAVIAQGFVLLALLTLLVVINVRLALSAGVVLTLAYGLVYTLTNRRLGRLGDERLEANSARVRVISEAFNGVKEIKVGGHESAYLQGYRPWSRRFGETGAQIQIIAGLPRFVLEAVAFGGMVLVVLILIAGAGDVSTVLPVVALYAFAGYRLMPAAQQLYAGVATLRSTASVLAAVHADMMALPRVPATGDPTDPAPFPVRTAIALEGVTFRYPGAPQPALRGLTLRIPARQTVGLVGSSGSGKTTTVDVILGLLEPEAGTLSVDGAPITSASMRRWQRTIGYVPQQIYLADDTVAANIALGIPRDRIDRAAVERAARVANLHDFVATQLPQGYDTSVGERGVRLSGGQRQRIGIARALYHRPQVLILDEATSALDNLTEQAVMEAVYNLGGEITVIMIAHRLSTVRGATRIFQLQAGQVVAEGTYEELLASSETFRAMAAHDA